MSMAEPKLPFYRRLWWWAIVAPLGLTVAIALTVFFVSLSHDSGYVVTFTRFTGSPDGPVYNLTDEAATQLPGHLPAVLTQARQAGAASMTLATQRDVERLSEGLRHSSLIRYQGELFRLKSFMAIN